MDFGGSWSGRKMSLFYFYYPTICHKQSQWENSTTVLCRLAILYCLWYNPVRDLTIQPEAALKHLLPHLPFALVLFIILFTGFTDVSIGVEPRVLVTLLAPLLWLGLYLLGSQRARVEA